MTQIILGLGANIGDPERAFRRAVESLARDHRLVASSRLYRTRPVGPEQPDFVNAAVLFDPRCPLIEFFDLCQRLEMEAGRKRLHEDRWGPRPLDLDHCIAHDVIHRSPRLTLPHPRLHERVFALAPAAEVAPDWVHPLIGRTLADLAHEAEQKDPGAIIGVEAFS